MKILGIEFAPLRIPMHRRLETLAVIYYVCTFLFMGFGGLLFMIFLLFTDYYFIPLGYLLWYLYDRGIAESGGRPREGPRNWKVWEWYKNYFPIKLVKTADLDPTQNYLLCLHPHGVLSLGGFCNFSTNATGFKDKYPGMRSKLLVLHGHFQFPLYREYFLQSGCVSCSKKSMNYLLSGKNGTGNAVVLLPGGAKEALEARPGSFVLNLKKRKGFVKMALSNGISLVPCFSFGENDLFDQINNPEGSFIKEFQKKLTKILGFSMPLFRGRGVFNYTIGLLPRRRPVTTVVGEPLPAIKDENPSEETVNKLHQRYIDALEDLFETHKDQYGIDKRRHLEIQ